MINIAFEGMTNNTGGKETYIINVFNALDKKMYKCFFIAYDEEIAYEQYLKDNGAIVVHVTSRNKNLFSFKKELNIFFSSNHIDALWAHKTTLSSCEILSIAKKHNVPGVYTQHSLWKDIMYKTACMVGLLFSIFYLFFIIIFCFLCCK